MLRVVTSVGPVSHMQHFSRTRKPSRARKRRGARGARGRPGGAGCRRADGLRVADRSRGPRADSPPLRRPGRLQALAAGGLIASRCWSVRAGNWNLYRSRCPAPLSCTMRCWPSRWAGAGAPPGRTWCTAVAAYQPLGYRWRRETMQGRLVINDAYNANPLSMRAALQAFARTPVQRPALAGAGFGMREMGVHAEPTRILPSGAKLPKVGLRACWRWVALAQGLADRRARGGLPRGAASLRRARGGRGIFARPGARGRCRFVEGSRSERLDGCDQRVAAAAGSQSGVRCCCITCSELDRHMVTPLRIFRYITFRALMGAATAFTHVPGLRDRR
jgi:hypothetical protein